MENYEENFENYLEESKMIEEELTVLAEELSSLRKDTALKLENARLSWHLGVIWRKDTYLSHVTREWIQTIGHLSPK